MSGQKHVVVLGGGPGGYSAGIYLAHLGAKVTLIEKQYLGGTCLNVGCIPTKAFVEASNNYAMIQDCKTYGLKLTGQVEVDGKKLQKFKSGIVKQLCGGVAYLLEKAGATVINGVGRLTGPKTVEATLADGAVQTFEADDIILATGSSEINLPGLEPDGTYILNSTQMLEMRTLPESIAIIGGGVIGVEFASIFSRFGKKVTIVELTSGLLPLEDHDVSAELREDLENSGVEILTETRAKEVVSRGPEGVVLALENQDGQVQELTVEKVLVCVGRRANLDGIGLEEAGVTYNKKYIPTDAHMQTNVPGIYAVGDITASPQLAHVAYHESRVAASCIMGKPEEADYHAVPACTFSHPEVAHVGLTEQEAGKLYPELKVVKEGFSGNGKAMIHQENYGFVKMLYDGATGKLVGCSIIGPKATELIAEPTLAVQLGIDMETFSHTINAHPSLSEMIGETAAAAVGFRLHSAE